MLKPGGEFWRVVLSPALVDETDFEQIAEMGAIFVAEGGEFDLDQGAEIQDAIRPDLFALRRWPRGISLKLNANFTCKRLPGLGSNRQIAR